MSFSIKWFGHSGFQIIADGKSIYIDPYEGDYTEKADIILLTHSHYDHYDPSRITRLNKGDTIFVAPPDCASRIKGRIRTLKPGEKTTIDNVVIEAVPAYNYKRFRSPGNPFHPKGFGVGYLVVLGDKTIYHAGDTDFIPEMKQLKNIYLALLPSGGTYTMDNLEAVEATLAINPKVAMPIHRFGTNPKEFKKRVEGASQIKVVLLQPGEKYEPE